ncbi:glutamate synthase [NADH] [Parelaphostrongylus tenuis]|uniref:Amino acid transporter n=1 Tax=Parelaphostrongylus tenuis TaxID=148309 RepID=A0AAD5RBI0_PARTN|nr:glutamate synthase [NADH] [Parelaphostrongylus tenuis]
MDHSHRRSLPDLHECTYSPLGILCLIMARILETDHLPGTAWTLGLYMLTVFIGLGVHLFISMPLIFLITTHKNPYDFMPGLLQAWMTAIGTSSSSVTLPITFNCVEEDLNVDRRVSRFVISIGSAVNMDGTALCMAVAAIFIAQLNGVEMSFLRVISVSFTVTLAAMCSAGVPSAGLILVLTSMGLPIGDVSLLLLADRIL